jgi:membrane protease YdiL (CAAX protease family)
MSKLRKLAAELRELLRMLRPLEATALAAGGLVLLLVWLLWGGRGFFAAHLAPQWLSGEPAEVVEWWSLIYQFACAQLLFLWLPLIVLRARRQSLRGLGLGLGDARAGFGVAVPLGILLLAIPGGLLASTQPDFVAEYPMARLAAASGANFAIYQLAYGLLYYAAYEAFFRGVLQLSLARWIGALSAILVQTAITTLLHIGKPAGEIFSALFAGLLFGALVLRLGSVWPLWLIHWALGAATDFFCARAGGLW